MRIFRYLKTVFIILNIILCCHGDLKAGYSSIQYGYRLLYRMIESYVNYSLLDCVEECLRTIRCASVNYYKGANFCEINFSTKITQPTFYRQAPGWLYTDIQDWDEVLADACAESSCEINEKCIIKAFGQIECVLSDCGIPVDIIENTKWNVQEWEGIGIQKRMHIKCLDSFVQRGSGMIVCHKNGTWLTDLVCEVPAADCKEILENGHTDSGVYQIYPNGADSDSVPAYCDMETKGGGWTVIQKRVNGFLSFDQDWAEYKTGFGSPEENDWIGNDVIHQLTRGNNSSLYVSITLQNGTSLYELYEKFAISDETEKYKLFLAGPTEGTLGDRMLNTGNPDRDLSGMYFSATDRDNDKLHNRVIKSYTRYSILDCAGECLKTTRCRSLNYFNGANFCEINFQIHTAEPAVYRERPGWIYTPIEKWNKDLVHSCSSSSCTLNEKCILQPFDEFRCVPSDCGILNVQNTSWNVQHWDGIGIYQQFHIKCSDSYLQRGSGRFLCLEKWTWTSNLICLDLPRDCKNLHENGENNSGVYEIYPFGSRARPARVFCDMYTMGGGWTAIQNRVNGSVSFNRTWEEYKKGFGDAGQDFWIGNNVIHQLTKEKISNLYISFTLVNGSRLYELYEQFSVSNETDSYRLLLAGNASGTLGDSMMHTGSTYADLSGMKFTTSDRDNDQWSTGSCAASLGGGWWFNMCNLAFLNGAWTPDISASLWYPTVKSWESVKETLMMIRPQNHETDLDLGQMYNRM